MTDLVNAVISEAKHTEPFLRLPYHLKKIFQIPFSASTADLANIVKSKKLPKFLHNARYYAELANKQVGKELLQSCNMLSGMMKEIWNYLRVIDPTIVIPDDAGDYFNFMDLNTSDYDVKLTARYWAQEISKVLLEIDSACRLAIKQQSRLVLCLFEVSPGDISVLAAYTVMFHTEKLSSKQEATREAFVEFAKVYASMMDSLNIPVLKDKISTESILFKNIEMDDKLVNHLDWLQKMLFKLPDTTLETWYQQFMLMGDWMNRIFVPWMKEEATVSLFPDSFPPKRKTGPIETVAAALAKPSFISYTDIQHISEVLRDLYLGKNPSAKQMTMLEDMCIKRTGMSLLEWSVTIDMALEYEPEPLVEGRLDTEIQKDIDEWTRRKNRAEEALNEFLRTRIGVDPENRLYKAFAEHIGDNYEDVDVEELVKKRNRWFENIDVDNFKYLIEYLVEYFTARNKLIEYQTEIRAPESQRSRVTLTLNQEIEEANARFKTLKSVCIQEASRRLRNRFDLEKFLSYIIWYQNDGYLLQINDKGGFKRETQIRLELEWEDIEPLFVHLEDLVKVNRKIKNLQEELSTHTNRLVRNRHILTVLIFIMFNVGLVLLLWKVFMPIYDETPVGVPTDATTGQPIIPTDAGRPPPQTVPPYLVDDSAFNTAASWAVTAGSLIGKWIYKKGRDIVEMNGWIGFDWGRLFRSEFWTDELWRGAGPVIMTLLYGKVLVSLGWSWMKLMWAVSTMFGTTLVNTISDGNFTETWQQERSNVTLAGQENYRALTASVLSMMEFHQNNARLTMLMGIQGLQYLPGGSVTRALTNSATNYVQSPDRAATSNTMRDWIENNNNDPRHSNSNQNQRILQTTQEQQRNPPDLNVIQGPRVVELANDNTQTTPEEDIKLLTYKPRETTDDDF